MHPRTIQSVTKSPLPFNASIGNTLINESVDLNTCPQPTTEVKPDFKNQLTLGDMHLNCGARLFNARSVLH